MAQILATVVNEYLKTIRKQLEEHLLCNIFSRTFSQMASSAGCEIMNKKDIFPRFGFIHVTHSFRLDLVRFHSQIGVVLSTGRCRYLSPPGLPVIFCRR